MKLGAFVMPSHPPERSLIENAWFVGSPDTVTRKIQKLQQDTGGFGGMLVMIYDFSSEQKSWEHSLELLTKEVMPNFPEP